MQEQEGGRRSFSLSSALSSSRRAKQHGRLVFNEKPRPALERPTLMPERAGEELDKQKPSGKNAPRGKEQRENERTMALRRRGEHREKREKQKLLLRSLFLVTPKPCFSRFVPAEMRAATCWRCLQQKREAAPERRRNRKEKKAKPFFFSDARERKK